MSIHFFDIGANIGQTFDCYLNKRDEFKGAHIWCFEPSPRHLPALMAKAASLGSRYKIHVCPFGLKGKTEAVSFYPKSDDRGDSFEPLVTQDHPQSNLKLGFDLLSIGYSMGDFLAQFTEAEDKVFLKLDCEGSEYEILGELRGCHGVLSRISEIMVEFHNLNAPSEYPTRRALEDDFHKIGLPLKTWIY